MDPLFELALAVKAVARELERWTNEAMRPLGVTGAQSDALAVIGRAEPISLTELGGLLVAESGHPSRLVDRLVAMGLVVRTSSADDRRRVELSLTAAGRQVVKRVETARQQVLDAARAVLAHEDVTAALALTEKLLALSPHRDLIARRRSLG